MKNEFRLNVFDPLAEFIIDACHTILKKKGYPLVMHHTGPDGPNVYQYSDPKTMLVISLTETDRAGEYRRLNLQAETIDLSKIIEEIYLEAYRRIGDKLLTPLTNRTLKSALSKNIGKAKRSNKG